ncbi:hypothetical protein [Streptomyces sp. NPDC048659]|uniref:hypothetical protein n=1 Tax=Streptomyces sp. NPDC048659 TaxID=3155489 RepID=UPI00342D9A42
MSIEYIGYSQDTTRDPNGTPHLMRGRCGATWRRRHNGYDQATGQDLGSTTRFGFPPCEAGESPIEKFVMTAWGDSFVPVYRCPDHS